VRKFYAQLRRGTVVGIEATFPAYWFERLLAELGHELWVGDAARIRATGYRRSWLHGSPLVAQRWTMFSPPLRPLNRRHRILCRHDVIEDLKIPNRRAAEERKIRAPHRYPNTTSAVLGCSHLAAPSLYILTDQSIRRYARLVTTQEFT